MIETTPFEVLQVPKPEIEKIRTPFARIMVSGTLKNPYYEILYYDPSDKKFHVGYGSFCLEFVFEWLSDAFEIIEQAPSVDAEEVIHGYWKYGTRAAVCSECGFERHLDDNFGAAISCPNCSAKMDGEVSHGDR